MKKKVAVFANGWSDEYIKNALDGIERGAKEFNADLYLFVQYAAASDKDDEAQGYINILSLPNLEQFDGILLLGNTLNNRGELGILYDKIQKINTPTVCLEYELDGIDCICTDNYSGMRMLCEHVVDCHGVKNVAFVSGGRDNLENLERLQALRDVLKDNNLELKDDSIIDGEWSYYCVRQQIPEWLTTHNMPDAFICANDVMAMGTVFALSKMGYSVPEDVIVTGFDNVISAQTYNPIITSVDRGWETRSYEGMKHLIDLINGAPKKGTIKHHSKLAIGESCGCTVSNEIKKKQANFINSAYTIPSERTMFDWHLSALDSVTSGVKDFDEVHDRFAVLFDDDPQIGYDMYESNTFCICLDEAFVESVNDTSSARCFGYGDRMDVIFAIRDGVPLPRQKINTSYIFPVFEKPDEGPNTYMISPLHAGSIVIGYVVFKNQFSLINMFYLNTWVMRISDGMIRAKQSIQMGIMNRKLSDMSINDELSGLYNRKGYEKRAIPLLQKIRNAGKQGVLMVADINKMKTINDHYGHLQGDLAIRLVSKAILSTLPDGWCGVRYGGDEFVILGENVFIDNGNIYKNQLIESVRKQAEDMMIPFELTISVGSVIIEPEEKVTLDEYFKLADNAMYEMKKALHAEREE